jgi:hypothetical protein
MNLESLRKDTAYALRRMRREPAFSVIMVLTLALGIGANTAIFSVIHAVLLQPLPYAEPERLVAVKGLTETNSSYLDFLDYRTQIKSFSHITAYARSRATLTMGSNHPHVVSENTAGVTVFEMILSRRFPVLRNALPAEVVLSR